MKSFYNSISGRFARNVYLWESISFHCYIAGNVMKVYSKNNYDTTEMKKHKKESSGVGLSNLRKRLQILYPGKHNLNVTQATEHFIVDVEIKLQ